MPDEKADEFVWLTSGQIARINQVIVGGTGEPHGILNAGLIESSAAAPRHVYLYEGEKSLAKLAVHLMASLGKNHCFAQGNKRTAFFASLYFLQINGQSLPAEDTLEFAQSSEALMVGAIEKSAYLEALDQVLAKQKAN